MAFKSLKSLKSNHIGLDLKSYDVVEEFHHQNPNLLSYYRSSSFSFT